jgi:hypothetical protein
VDCVALWNHLYRHAEWNLWRHVRHCSRGSWYTLLCITCTRTCKGYAPGWVVDGA